MSETYAHPEYLVETEWVEENLTNPNVRIVESDEDVLLYEAGHIPGAVKVDWFSTLQHPIRRDFLTKEAFEELCSNIGITTDTTIVFYGDKSNWFACYALWLFEYFGHEKLRVMNGGRLKWELENRPLTREAPEFQKSNYTAKEPDESVRAFRNDVFSHLEKNAPLVDVRSPQEFRGELLHMPGYPQEGRNARRGHIPGAVTYPGLRLYRRMTNTFKSVGDSKIYQDKDLTPEKQIIAYCRIGEREFPHMVRTKVFTRLSKCKKLRWFVDRMG
jgi:thiosulfate/3-mercaptopyruvate sulfurtransferase